MQKHEKELLGATPRRSGEAGSIDAPQRQAPQTKYGPDFYLERQAKPHALELFKALKALTEAAEFDFCGESTADCADDECVAMEDGSAFTFGMIRRARAAIAKAEGR